MKHLFKPAISLALAVALCVFYTNAVAYEAVNDTADNIGLNQSEDADLDRIQPDDPDQDRFQSDDPDLDRLQDGDQTGTSDEGSEDIYEYLYEEPQSSLGVAVDENLQPVETQTYFRAWLATVENVIENGGLYQGDQVQLGSELSVDNEDVGKTVECLVVVQYKTHEDAEEQTFMLTDNSWEVWGGKLDELTGANCQLGEVHQIMALEGELISGVFKIHFGYQFETGGIVASPAVLIFTVQ